MSDQLVIVQDEQAANPAKRKRTAEPEIVGPPVLPAEMFELVIGQMNLNELVVCRAVCKFFKQVIDRIKLRSVVIAENEDSTCASVFSYGSDDYDWAERVEYPRYSDQFWFVSNDPVYESDALIATDITAGLRMLVNHFDLSQLRRLFTVDVYDGRAHFDLLNRLVQLEHLQINWIQLDCDLRLQLPNLRTLSIVQVDRIFHYRITLATPNLKHFETRSLHESKFRFEHPDSVVFLQVSRCSFEDVFELRANLEVLISEWAHSLVYIDHDKDEDDEDRIQTLNLSAFEKLRRVDCARMMSEVGEELQYLCDRNGVDLYFCGCGLDNNAVLESYLDRAERKGLLQLLKIESMFNYYDQLADSMYICEGIRYFKWFNCYFPDQLPENFAKKFYLVRAIYVEGEIKNVDYFVQFLSCFKNLKLLQLNCATLPQEFFDRHSHLLARLHEFTYTHNPISSLKKDEVNLDFIVNFKLLEKFGTNRPISMHLISEAFNSLKYLKRFYLEENWDRYLEKEEEKSPKFIIRRTEDGYSLNDFGAKGSPKFDFSSKAELLKFVEERFPALSKSVNQPVC